MPCSMGSDLGKRVSIASLFRTAWIEGSVKLYFSRRTAPRLPFFASPISN